MSAVSAFLIGFCLASVIELILGVLLFRARGDLVEAQRGAIDILQSACAGAAKVFSHYAELHDAKNTPEGRDKAARNRIMAKMMADALLLSGREDDAE